MRPPISVPLLLGFLSALLLNPEAAAQNSTRKIRSAPSATAKRAGDAVPWRRFEEGLAEAERTGKPVFWYIASIEGSYMDRIPEVGRAMRAGPFSWPRIIDLLSEHYVPVAVPAGLKAVEAYDLKPIEFIGPGYMILAPDGSELARQDRLTTLHPLWFEAQLASHVGAEVDLESTLPWRTPEGELGAAEALFLEGAEAWFAKRPGDSRDAWELLVADHPEHPLAWKAAMELEGHGPLARGLESWAPLPEGALTASGRGTLCAEGIYDEAELWRRGLGYLIDLQRADGSFRDTIYDFGGTDSLPNVYVAITAIAATTMVHGLQRLDESNPEDKSLADRVRPALAQALRFCLDDDHLALEDTDEIVFAHIYRIRAAAEYRRRMDGEELARDLKDLAQGLLGLQNLDGSWSHEYANPFVTSNALIALSEAREDEPHRLEQGTRAGVQALLRCRTDDGAYTYGMARPGRPARAAIQGSVGRTPLGELALTLWSPDDSLGLEKAIAISFEHEEHLLPVRKYDDHTRNFAYGGFFFWYDMHGRTEAIAALPRESKPRAEFVERQRKLILSLPEIDGTFIDSHEVGKVYGTAMALWCLAELD